MAAPRWLGQRLLADSVTAPPHNTLAEQTNGFRQFGFTDIVYELAMLFLSKHPAADGLVRLSNLTAAGGHHRRKSRLASATHA